MNWFKVCEIHDVSEDMPKAIEIKGNQVGIFKVDEDFFAIENVCPHAFALLTDGFIEDEKVECPLHEAIFDIKTGVLESGPGCRNLHIYPTKVEGEEILIQCETN